MLQNQGRVTVTHEGVKRLHLNLLKMKLKTYVFHFHSAAGLLKTRFIKRVACKRKRGLERRDVTVFAI